ncbi:MAG: hypothetical protein ACK5BB_01005 [Burkholderiaceae bacterium]|jgi:hypothetical protein
MYILAVAILYFVGFYANDVLFANLEHHRSAHWIFLPAGLRLLSILLLGSIGAIGIFLGSLLVAISMGQITPLGIIVESLISAGAPLLTYYVALRYGLSVNLKNLNAKSLFVLATLFAAASALMHSIWYATQGIAESFATSFLAMFVGNLLGTIIVLYIIRAGLIFAGNRWKR